LLILVARVTVENKEEFLNFAITLLLQNPAQKRIVFSLTNRIRDFRGKNSSVSAVPDGHCRHTREELPIRHQNAFGHGWRDLTTPLKWRSDSHQNESPLQPSGYHLPARPSY
jgi:hypothetical protein